MSQEATDAPAHAPCPSKIQGAPGRSFACLQLAVGLMQYPGAGTVGEQVMTNWIPIVDSWGSKLLCLIAYTSCTTGEKHSLKPHQPQVVCGAAQVTGERTP